MSYDISFKCKIEGCGEYIDTGDCEANITYNLRDMIVKSTGLDWKNEGDNGFVSDVIPYIKRCISSMKRPTAGGQLTVASDSSVTSSLTGMLHKRGHTHI